jgi:hypothetical protein
MNSDTAAAFPMCNWSTPYPELRGSSSAAQKYAERIAIFFVSVILYENGSLSASNIGSARIKLIKINKDLKRQFIFIN